MAVAAPLCTASIHTLLSCFIDGHLALLHLNLLVRQVLDILDENNAKCTFFNIANFCDAAPGSIHEMVARGHELGNHLCEVTQPHAVPRTPLRTPFPGALSSPFPRVLCPG